MPETAMAEAPAKAATGGNILQVRNLEAWYGESHILHGINFDVNAGEVVTLLGRNGAGKTTTLKSIMGIIGKRAGSIKFNNQDIIRATSDKIARMGIAFCPEERGFSPVSTCGRIYCCRRWCARADCRSNRSSICFRT